MQLWLAILKHDIHVSSCCVLSVISKLARTILRTLSGVGLITLISCKLMKISGVLLVDFHTNDSMNRQMIMKMESASLFASALFI